MRCRPVGKGLRPGRLGEGVARRPEHRDEHLRLALLAGLAVHHRDRLTGVVHEHLLARAVFLAHHHVERSDANARYCSQNWLYCNPSGWDRLVLLPQQARASPPCDEAPGGPCSTPATDADVPLGAGARETAGAQAPASSSDPGNRPTQDRSPPPGACTRPPSRATSLTLRAIARTLIPAAWYSRRTSRILRMDNLLLRQLVGPPCKSQGGVPQMAGCPASLSPDCRRPISTGIGDRFRPESVIGLDRNQ